MIEVNPEAERLMAVLSRRSLAWGELTDSNWEHIVALAVRYSVAPVFYARLKERALTPPPRIAEYLQQICFAGAVRSVRLFHELGKILRSLEAASIPVIPLKGAVLAEAVYGDIALRPMVDVDLWVQRQRLESACSIMQSLGYSTRSRQDRPLALQDALTGETQMFGPNGRLVELHWNIFSGEWLRHTTQIDERAVWDRSVPLNGRTARQLSPEDAVIHLCVHLAVNHQMGGIGLRTLLDLDYARRKWTIDWGLLAQRAHAWRVASATWLVLDGLAELFGDPEHQLPLRELAPTAARQSVLARFGLPRLLAEGLDLSQSPRRFLFLLLLVDRPADATVLVWRAFFPDRQWLTLRYDLADAPRRRIWLQRTRHLLRVATGRGF